MTNDILHSLHIEAVIKLHGTSICDQKGICTLPLILAAFPSREEEIHIPLGILPAMVLVHADSISFQFELAEHELGLLLHCWTYWMLGDEKQHARVAVGKDLTQPESLSPFSRSGSFTHKNIQTDRFKLWNKIAIVGARIPSWQLQAIKQGSRVRERAPWCWCYYSHLNYYKDIVTVNTNRTVRKNKRYCTGAVLPQQPPLRKLLVVGAVLHLILLLLCLCSADDVHVYTPIDQIFVNCGSDGDSITSDGRSWAGDVNSKYSLLDSRKSLTNKASTQPSGVDQVPYTTARLSRSEFSYSFPVTAGPKFLRLHFFSSTYNQNLSRSDAVFSVTSGRFTLLHNFSVSLVADNLELLGGGRSFFREFCVLIKDSQRLNLTFTPSTDASNSYALVNGIEIVSMPSDLYYSNSSHGSRDLNFLGNNGNPLTLREDDALETVHRINVGGTFLGPGKDTGMFRTWMGPDDAYLTEDLASVLPVNTSISLIFDKIPNYTAPQDVYRTARSMGTDRTENFSYNLTWSFTVDSNFRYIVRLHFCEFQIEITKEGDRVFEIFIDSLEAESMSDVIRWTGGRGTGIPIYRDYAIDMLEQGSKKVNLTVALHPASETFSIYADALLNGVEIFKISSTDGNLAGPNPDPVASGDMNLIL
ncbi:hypothetical protein SAY87_020649 [Trapa incisa]|uniref:Malectin-like domain-containing protein n=1 Tax=Trapa incisa TaxID=236973 RepID=A0AAN7JQN0_9MYRT|nr:hypothetical protein SAY87_020649 [Trapa incisa]